MSFGRESESTCKNATARKACLGSEAQEWTAFEIFTAERVRGRLAARTTVRLERRSGFSRHGTTSTVGTSTGGGHKGMDGWMAAEGDSTGGTSGTREYAEAGVIGVTGQAAGAGSQSETVQSVRNISSSVGLSGISGSIAGSVNGIVPW